jgi:aminoglycoside 6'-N-acetyltransferase I
VRIVDLRPGDASLVRQVAEVLVEGFREHEPEAFPDMGAALAEVRRSFDPERLSRVAVETSGEALGWIGGIRHYRGRAWELHPLVVRPGRQRQGIGRALVRDLEERVRERGAVTLWLGTDDVDAQTSLSGVDLYPDVLGHAARIENLRGHPYGFYQKLGYVVVGVLPDANGPGRPDIFMAKRVGR